MNNKKTPEEFCLWLEGYLAFASTLEADEVKQLDILSKVQDALHDVAFSKQNIEPLFPEPFPWYQNQKQLPQPAQPHLGRIIYEDDTAATVTTITTNKISNSFFKQNQVVKGS